MQPPAWSSIFIWSLLTTKHKRGWCSPSLRPPPTPTFTGSTTRPTASAPPPIVEFEVAETTTICRSASAGSTSAAARSSAFSSPASSTRTATSNSLTTSSAPSMRTPAVRSSRLRQKHDAQVHFLYAF
ncbi:hypothetical protein VPH35_129529 [Triticum aestivum]